MKNYIGHAIRYSETPIGEILMLHRIESPNLDRLWYNEHLKISPSLLEAFIISAKRKGCSFVSLDELAEIINKKRRATRLIVITMDDGYKDNFTNGTPLFKTLNIPYTIYVCTQLVERKLFLWWYILEDLILQNRRIELSDGRIFACATKEEKEQAFLDLRLIILQLPQDNLRNRINELFDSYDINSTKYDYSVGLNWQELKLLGKEPLCTLGNHSHSHLAFNRCNNEEIISDIHLAQDLMIQNAGIIMKHFAFPFGEQIAVSQNDIELIKQLGFITSATTNNDFLRYKTDLLELPRMFVTDRNMMKVLDRIVYEC